MIKIDTLDAEWKEKLKTVLPEYGHTPATFIYNDGKKRAVRLARSSDKEPMVMSKGKKRWGRTLDNYIVRDITFIAISEKKADEKEKWEKSWKKVIARLTASGLNEDYLKDVKTGFDIGYEKIKKANDIYWDARDEEQIKQVESIDSRFIGVREDGSKYVDTGILWTTHHPAKIKKMYFGKYRKYVLDALGDAIKNKVEYKNYATAGYDVSVHYSPETNRLWYSEEYRNCGNGHYYLGLDATHAVFYEDD